MMLNKNKAVSFYGTRPVHGHMLDAKSGMIHPHSVGQLSGLGKEALKVYLPGSVGSQLIGGTIDKVADIIGKAISTAFPTLGTALYFVTDAIAWAVKPTGDYLNAMVEGVVTYLPEQTANGVCKWLDENKTDLALEAFKDTMYAFYRRVHTSGAQATDAKQGRDKILGMIMGGILEVLGVGHTASRLADKVAAKAKEIGAEDWQIGAAVGYGMAVGLPSAGFPANLTLTIPDAIKSSVIGNFFGDTIKITGSEAGKRILSVVSETQKYLVMLAPNPDMKSTDATKKWINVEFTKKSGVDRDKEMGKGGGAALPLLAVAALAFLSSK